MDNFRLIKELDNYEGWCVFEDKKKIGRKDLYLELSGKKRKISLLKRKVELRFKMPLEFEAGGGVFEYEPKQVEVGIFRFPFGEEVATVEVMKSGEKKPVKIKERALTFEAWKIEIFGFEVLEIREYEFGKCRNFWLSCGIDKKEIDRYLDGVKKKQEENYEKLFLEAEKKVKKVPQFLEIIRMVLGGKMSSEEANLITGGIITEGIK